MLVIADAGQDRHCIDAQGPRPRILLLTRIIHHLSTTEPLHAIIIISSRQTNLRISLVKVELFRYVGAEFSAKDTSQATAETMSATLRAARALSRRLPRSGSRPTSQQKASQSSRNGIRSHSSKSTSGTTPSTSRPRAIRGITPRTSAPIVRRVVPAGAATGILNLWLKTWDEFDDT